MLIADYSPFRRGLCDSVSAILRQFLGQLLLFFRVSVLPTAGQIKRCLSFDQTLCNNSRAIIQTKRVEQTRSKGQNAVNNSIDKWRYPIIDRETVEK